MEANKVMSWLSENDLTLDENGRVVINDADILKSINGAAGSLETLTSAVGDAVGCNCNGGCDD